MNAPLNSATNTLTYSGYSARVEFDAEDRLFVGHIAGIRDIVGFHGASVDELEAAFHEAVDDYLAACEKLGPARRRSCEASASTSGLRVCWMLRPTDVFPNALMRDGPGVESCSFVIPARVGIHAGIQTIAAG